jgi:hypothetical protein
MSAVVTQAVEESSENSFHLGNIYRSAGESGNIYFNRRPAI